MSTKQPEVISETNLSYAWGRAFLNTIERSKWDMTPLILSIADLNDGLPDEERPIREALDETLARHDRYSSAVSAMVIFPFKIWNLMARPHVHEFSEFYVNKYLPRLRARNSQNRRGTYFERMIAFQGVRGKAGKVLNEPKNQLEHIIGLWPKNGEHARPRQSALQVACFDPVKDHTGATRSGFPCLQQVSFTYDEGNGLAVNAFYPTQYIFDRGYGNYVGLCHLGYFMARELGLELVRLNCFICRPELGAIPKSRLRELTEIVKTLLPD